MKRLPHYRRLAAFTLIEVLTVIAIVAMLGAMGFAGLRYAMNKSRESDVRALLTDISKAIQEYKDERGNYPRPAMEEAAVSIDGESFPVGGAQMLYQVLSGDGTDAIKGGEKVPTGQQGSAADPADPYSGRIYMDSVVAPVKSDDKENQKKSKLVEANGDTGYYVIDPWRHPLQYQVAEKDKNGQITNDIKLHSGSNYELWSFGNCKKVEDGEEAQKKWITNWGGR